MLQGGFHKATDLLMGRFSERPTAARLTMLLCLGRAHCWVNDLERLTERQQSPQSDTSFPALLQGGFQEVERFLTGQGLNTNLVANKVSQAGTVAGEPAEAVQVLYSRPANANDTTALMSC